MYGDNEAALSAIENPTNHSKAHYVRELVEGGKLTVAYVPSEENPAVMLTKGIGRIKNEKHSKSIGVAPWGSVVESCGARES
jgi:hypothetical protein